MMENNSMKEAWKPGTLIYPLPAVLVSCGTTPEEYNMLTIAWTGTVCTNPPMCYISVRKERHSYDIIRRTGEFAINLTTEALARATDWCGVRSGRDNNKWQTTGLCLSRACGIREFKVTRFVDVYLTCVLFRQLKRDLNSTANVAYVGRADDDIVTVTAPTLRVTRKVY